MSDRAVILLFYTFKFERPEDDGILQDRRTKVLNRIDQQFGCNVLVWHDEYCGEPELDPFSDRCRYHSGALDDD